MLKFSEYAYVKPDIDKIKIDLNTLINTLKETKSVDEQVKVIEEINKYREEIETSFSLAQVRYTINTSDKFYDEANNLVDEISPIYTGLINNYYKAILASPFRAQLEKVFGSQLFKLAEVSLLSFDEKIIEDLQQENKLSSQYTKLLATGRINFRNKKFTLAQMGKFMSSKNRRTRKAASKAYYAFFEENLDTLDKIYDDLVKVRDTMAKKLGYKNFVELGYKRLGRTDYDAKMVANYREQIYKDLVPVAQNLISRQIKRIKIKEPQYYDFNLKFTSGNPTPKGDKDWMVNNAKEMYDELSKETSEFFDFMLNHDLLDLDAKPNKAGGGYCTYFSAYKSPFIFANFNGTSHDVEVLTHEVGHAFQIYNSRNLGFPEYGFPTLEACEIHSMSMEFFTWPWMEKFFKEDVDKFKFAHLSGAITFIPYGVAVDEFQHFVYENSQVTPKQRRAKWREIEKKYIPSLNYQENEFLENGGFWMRQSHIFSSPFYYIDYTLAQVVAFQFFNEMHEDYQKAWAKYVSLCKLGGSKSFLGLLEATHLNLPFNNGTVKKAVAPLEKLLATIDDTKL